MKKIDLFLKLSIVILIMSLPLTYSQTVSSRWNTIIPTLHGYQRTNDYIYEVPFLEYQRDYRTTSPADYFSFSNTSSYISTYAIYYQSVFDVSKLLYTKEPYVYFSSGTTTNQEIILYQINLTFNINFGGTIRPYRISANIIGNCHATMQHEVMGPEGPVIIPTSVILSLKRVQIEAYQENNHIYTNILDISHLSSENLKHLEIHLSGQVVRLDGNNRHYGIVQHSIVYEYANGTIYSPIERYSVGYLWADSTSSYIQAYKITYADGSMLPSSGTTIRWRSVHAFKYFRYIYSTVGSAAVITQTYENIVRETPFGWLPPEDEGVVDPEFPDIPNTIKWQYDSFFLETDEVLNQTLETNVSVINDAKNGTENNTLSFYYSFARQKVSSRSNIYYIYTQVVDPVSWGNWEIRMFEGTAIEAVLPFNWLRNGIVSVVNAIAFVFQIIFYLLIIAFNYLFLFLILNLVVIIWNYPIYWLYVGLVASVFYLSFFFVWLWNQIMILWNLIIVPILIAIWNWIIENVWNPLVVFVKEFIEWLKTEGFIIIYSFIIVVLSYIVSAILFVVCMGSVDYNTIFQFVLQINSYLLQLMVEFFMAFFGNFLVLLQAVALYFVIIGFLMLKLLYAKAKGYTSRVEKIQSAINFYKYPIDIAYRLLQTFLATKATENT